MIKKVKRNEQAKKKVDNKKAGGAEADKAVLAEKKAQALALEAKEKEEALEAVEREKQLLLAKKEKLPPPTPRILVLGGTGQIGKAVVDQLKKNNVYVVATSKTGKEDSVKFEITKDTFGKLEQSVTALAKQYRASGIVNCISGGIGTDEVSLLAGCNIQIATGAKEQPTVRNFVALGPSPTLRVKTPPELKTYVQSKTFAENIVKSKFGGSKDGGDENEDYTYTLLNPGAVGNAKNYSKDKSVPLDVIADAISVASSSFYLKDLKLGSMEVSDPNVIKELSKKKSALKEFMKGQPSPADQALYA